MSYEVDVHTRKKLSNEEFEKLDKALKSIHN